jgi:hypothetical protein
MSSTDPRPFAVIGVRHTVLGSITPDPDGELQPMLRRSSAAIGALLLISAIVLAACGGGSTATGTAPSAAPATAAADEPTTPDATAATGGGVEGNLTPGTDLNACEIVTTADVAAAFNLKTPVAEGALKASPTILSPGHTECRYEGEYGGIIVALTPEDGANLYDAARGAYKDAADIAGIGDGAFNSDKNHRAFIWKDKVTVMLTMFVGELSQMQVATDLGNAIIEKL